VKRSFQRIAFFALAGLSTQSPIPVFATQCEIETCSRPEPVRGAVTDHVIVISIDGLRPDAIAQYRPETLRRLMAQGAYSLRARTISPSKTLPSHTSMLTGVPPEIHGVTWNSDRTDDTGVLDVETIFEVAKREGFKTAAFMSKAKLKHLAKPGTLDHVEAPNGRSVLSATETIESAVRYLRHEQPNLMFVHIAEPDVAGHSVGWMSFAYGWAVKRADAGVGQLLKAADATYGRGNYTVIVTADHGGHGRGHGDESDIDTEIPWISSGAGVESGEIGTSISTMDTAATVLWLLGLHEPVSWEGRAVASAFTSSARVAVEAALLR
jgi:predicted AlkP superfamily pyrophosphatase or phosphodiesterase